MHLVNFLSNFWTFFVRALIKFVSKFFVRVLITETLFIVKGKLIRMFNYFLFDMGLLSFNLHYLYFKSFKLFHHCFNHVLF